MASDFSVLYLDTSSLLKTVFAEPESEAVDAALAGEDAVVITPLAELEALVQVTRARWLAGALTKAKYRRLLEMLESLKEFDPSLSTNFPVPSLGWRFASIARPSGFTVVRSTACILRRWKNSVSRV